MQFTFIKHVFFLVKYKNFLFQMKATLWTTLHAFQAGPMGQKNQHFMYTFRGREGVIRKFTFCRLVKILKVLNHT